MTPVPLLRQTLMLSLAILLLAGCGGLSKDEADETFGVNAGRDRSVAEQSTVALTAQASYPTGAVTYSWTATPALTITHADPNVSTASLVTPVVTTDTPADDFWSSTPSLHDAERAWTVAFFNASYSIKEKQRAVYLRLVKTHLPD